MRFTLIDQIVELEPGARIGTVKNLTMAEEYLDDHFPRFPVLPGVLMIEAMTQTCAWLVRATDDFAHSIVILKEARNVKYGKFVRPGQSLAITAELRKRTGGTAQFDVQGTVDGQLAVGGKLTIEHYNLADRRPTMPQTDRELNVKMRRQFDLLYQPKAERTSA
jgi:3-hydroxyacyl-[acyl-carrier-protein] dehydratase